MITTTRKARALQRVKKIKKETRKRMSDGTVSMQHDFEYKDGCAVCNFNVEHVNRSIKKKLGTSHSNCVRPSYQASM